MCTPLACLQSFASHEGCLLLVTPQLEAEDFPPVVVSRQIVVVSLLRMDLDPS